MSLAKFMAMLKAAGAEGKGLASGAMDQGLDVAKSAGKGLMGFAKENPKTAVGAMGAGAGYGAHEMQEDAEKERLEELLARVMGEG